MIKEGLLQQSAIDETDSFASPQKQFTLLSALLAIHRQGLKLVKQGVPARLLIQMPLLAQARRWKSQYTSENLAGLQERIGHIPTEFAQIALDYESSNTLGGEVRGEVGATP